MSGLASLQDSLENVRFLETSGKNLRLELSFDSPISDVEEHILLGEGMPTEKIVQFGTRAKSVLKFQHY